MARTRARGAALKLMESVSPPRAGANARASSKQASAAQPTAPEAASTAPLEALVDGKRVLIQAADEIVLQCGKASITLRRNGRVVIRGTYVETRAEGVNRVKGGSVQIN